MSSVELNVEISRPRSHCSRTGISITGEEADDITPNMLRTLERQAAGHAGPQHSRKLAIKKRTSANRSEQGAFAKHDLLLIAATGSAPDRRNASAHFAGDEVKGNAATLKARGWDAHDTPRRLRPAEGALKAKLNWPGDPPMPLTRRGR